MNLERKDHFKVYLFSIYSRYHFLFCTIYFIEIGRKIEYFYTHFIHKYIKTIYKNIKTINNFNVKCCCMKVLILKH